MPAALAALLLVVPVVALVVAAPWGTLAERLASQAVGEALVISLGTSLATVLVCLLLGTPLAWVLARLDLPGLGLLRALVAVPLVLPPVVAGVALVTAFGRTGVVGAPLREAFGLTLPYTTAGVVLAHVFCAMPFYVLSVEGALRSAGERCDAVAATLGASRWYAFRRVVLPLAVPGVLAGCVLAWARSLGEFGATITFAGNFPGTTQTMPSLVYTALQADADDARALALVLLAVSLAVLAGLRHRWLDPLRGRRRERA
ncbi:molybdate ABC transporter permease subunit [Nocardioides bruguierae]|uniref:Molybdenum transport system permease n=1 Tax=Nocardioides bruguierae TaxID=2945102 RepID=A0A9X2DCN3_9ACTN|nr:molybdate ABC transporter permease subunit [Nocardioides bruguierae]MCM0622034.1 molybdate ABC transporter permease subunit [Nocardioides bruguierae]